MKNVSFSTGSEKADFQGRVVPAGSPSGFLFDEGWMDVETAPSVCYAGFLLLDAAIAHRRHHAGSLSGMGCLGLLPAVFSTATGGAYVLQFGMYAARQ